MKCEFCNADRAKPCHFISEALACKHGPQGIVREMLMDLQGRIRDGDVVDLGEGKWEWLRTGLVS